MSTNARLDLGGKQLGPPDVDPSVDDPPRDAPRRARRSPREEELVSQQGDPAAHVRAGQMLDIALEIVDRLVDAVDELEEGVGGVVDRAVEDAAAGRVGVDPCSDAVDGRDVAARARLADGDDRRGRGDHVELEVLHARLARDA